MPRASPARLEARSSRPSTRSSSRTPHTAQALAPGATRPPAGTSPAHSGGSRTVGRPPGERTPGSRDPTRARSAPADRPSASTDEAPHRSVSARPQSRWRARRSPRTAGHRARERHAFDCLAQTRARGVRVATGRFDLSMAEDHLNLVQRTARLRQLGPQTMTELMRRDDTLDPSSAPERPDNLTRATVTHRPTDLAAAEVDEHEIRPARRGNPVSLEAIGGVDPHQPRVRRHSATRSGRWPSATPSRPSATPTERLTASLEPFALGAVAPANDRAACSATTPTPTSFMPAMPCKAAAPARWDPSTDAIQAEIADLYGSGLARGVTFR